MSDQQVRVAIILCNCGETLESKLNYTNLQSHFKSKNPDVDFLVYRDLCFKERLNELAGLLKTKTYDWCVIAACTPQVIEMVIKNKLKSENLESNFEIVNIREQCAWVHEDKARATKKAIALIQGAISKVQNAVKISKKEAEFVRHITIIGGGISGLSAASDLCEFGFKITIIEKDPTLGGHVLQLEKISSFNQSGKEVIDACLKTIEDKDIDLKLNTHVQWIEGGVGNYTLHVISQEKIEETIKTSFVVFSTGFKLYHPDERTVFQMDRYPDILTQFDLAQMLDRNGSSRGKIICPSTNAVAKKILMVQCVGSRDVDHGKYCSKYCCSVAIRHAIEIKERDPECDICICYIDIRTPFLDEEIYRRARELGVNFTRGKIGDIQFEANHFVTQVIDTILAQQINYESDIIVLSTAMIPNKLPSEILEISGLKLDNNGFIQQYYPKLKTTETNKIGMYVCGTASGPKLVSECIADAHSVALSIIKDYSDATLVRDSPISIVDEELCNGCELCVRICPFKIPKLIQKNENVIAQIDKMQCLGCGTCVSLCPTNAVQLESLQRDQLFAQIRGILVDASINNDPIILSFVCEECAYATVDFAGMLQKRYSENIRFIRVPCAGRVSILDILTAFEHGADLVLIYGCEEEKCHYLEGNVRTRIVVEVINELLDEIGWESKRLKMHGLFSADVDVFLNSIQEALKVFEELGHTNLRLKLLNNSEK